MPQVIGNKQNRSKPIELLERMGLRPRQVRYPGATTRHHLSQRMHRCESRCARKAPARIAAVFLRAGCRYLHHRAARYPREEMRSMCVQSVPEQRTRRSHVRVVQGAPTQRSLRDQTIDDSERVITHRPSFLTSQTESPSASLLRKPTTMASSRRWIPAIGAAGTWRRKAGIGIGGWERTNSTTLISVSSSNSPCRTNGQPRSSSPRISPGRRPAIGM